MIGFITVVHILIAVALCALVLVQDSKGGGALGIGGSGSNSLLGATGAQTLAAKLTKYMAILFAVSCVALTYFLAHDNKSVVDQLGTAVISAPPSEAKDTAPAVPGTEASPSTAPGSTTPDAGKSPTTSGQPASNDKK